MKLRLGFVSNSSTSSFVIFGAKITEEQETKYFDAETGNPRIIMPNLQTVHDDSFTYAGWELGHGSSEGDCFDVRTTTLEELVQFAAEFEKTFGTKPKLIGGIRAC